MFSGLRCFGDAQLERAYRLHQLRQHTSLLVYVLCVFTAALLLLALNHLPNPDMVLLLSTVSAAISLALNIVLNIQANTSSRRGAASNALIVAIAVWMCFTVVAMLPASGQSALLPCIIVVFSLYTAFPFDLLWVMAAASALSLAQVTSFILLSGRLPFTNQLIATVLVHVWCNFIGVYVFITRSKISREAFANERNALASHHDAMEARIKMGTLLSAALPPHIVQSVQDHLGSDAPRLYVEHYDHVSVLYAKYYGLQLIVKQLSAQDSVRLLNEFNSRIDMLVERYNLIRVPSDCIQVVAGMPRRREDHALSLCLFARDLQAIIRTFSEATSADLRLKISIANGPITSGIIGAKKWHYDIIGQAVDVARELEASAPLGSILISEETRRQVLEEFALEKCGLGWRLLHLLIDSNVASPLLPSSLLFPVNQRRFSLVTVPQAVHRLLQANAIHTMDEVEEGGGKLFKSPTSDSILICQRRGGRRKGVESMLSADESPAADEAMEYDGLMTHCTMAFRDRELEALFHSQLDQWFIPALAICTFYLVLYGVYQVLVMPLLASNLALIVASLGLMFIGMLMLYVHFFESFCQFVTRTPAGHSISILLILCATFTCGMVNIFSCPSYTESRVCHVVHYSTASCAIWMLASAAFVRFQSLHLLLTLLSAVFIYAIHVFGTHADLYVNFSFSLGWRVEFDLLIALVTLAMILFLQARRNERTLRADFVSTLRSSDGGRQLEKFDFLNEQILLNMLPVHVAHNYHLRTDPYSHLCHSVGVVTIKFGHAEDWQGEWGFDKLNRIIFEVDQLLDTSREALIGVEKVRTSHAVYTAAVGVLPEMSKNVHDAPLTIGDLLASLANFALKAREVAEAEGVDVAVGLDCGSALSMVLGGERPRYEVVGVPRIRAGKLMHTASNFICNRARSRVAVEEGTNRLSDACILVSEEILLALRPREGRTFWLDDRHPVNVSAGLMGYLLLSHQPTTQQHTQLRTIPPIPPPMEDEECPYSMPANTHSAHMGHTQHLEEEISTVISLGEGSTSDSSEDCGTAGNADCGVHTDDIQIYCSTVPSTDDRKEAMPISPDQTFHAVQRYEHGKPTTSNGIGARGKMNPFEITSSLNSSFSSELCSIDVSVESGDSELEWITPGNMVVNSLNKPPSIHLPHSGAVNGLYKSGRAREYSDFSENEPLRSRRCHLPGTSQSPYTCHTGMPQEPRPGGNFGSARMHRRRRFRLPNTSKSGSNRVPSWMSSRASSTNYSNMTSRSSLELNRTRPANETSLSALDRLNAAAKRVDRMLLELAIVDNSCLGANNNNFRFPTRRSKNNSLSASRSIQSLTCPNNFSSAAGHKLAVGAGRQRGAHRSRDVSSANQTDYDNAESVASNSGGSEVHSDSEMAISTSKLEELKRALRPTLANLNAYRLNRLPQLRPFGQITKQNLPHVGRTAEEDEERAVQQQHPDIPSRFPPLKIGRPLDTGNEADIESSNCSSLASSRLNFALRKPKWRQSIHSIGYDNEYELASANTSHNSSLEDGIHFSGLFREHFNEVPAQPSVGEGSDFIAVDAEDVDAGGGHPLLNARNQMQQLSKDIQRNFGEFQLATFSDIDKSD